MTRSREKAETLEARYGRFYGPGTYYEAARPEPPCVHVDDAARRTIAALSAANPGVFTVVE